MATVTKKELVNRIAEVTGHTKVVAKDVIQAFLDMIIAELAAGNRLEFREFGVFETRVRAPRKAQNPQTMARVEVPARRIVKFKVGRVMRAKVAGEDPGPAEPDDDESTVTTAKTRKPPSRAQAERE
ncbi:MAG: HU family DNA-binding protein [Planctomycetota bacterium]